MSTNNKVVVMKKLEDVETSDIRAGIQVYSDIERQVGNLREAIAPWVMRIAKHYFDGANGMPELAGARFEAAMEAEVLWITSEKAGAKRLKPEHAKLKGSSPLAKAFRKIRLSLELGGDLNKLTTVSQCEEYNKEANKQKKLDEERDATAQRIKLACMEAVLLKHPDIDFESDEGKGLLEHEIASYTLRMGNSADNHLTDVSDSLELEEMDEFDKAGHEMASIWRELYSKRTDLLEGDKKAAMAQVESAMTSAKDNARAKLDKCLAALRATIDDIDEDDDDGLTLKSA